MSDTVISSSKKAMNPMMKCLRMLPTRLLTFNALYALKLSFQYKISRSKAPKVNETGNKEKKARVL